MFQSDPVMYSSELKIFNENKNTQHAISDIEERQNDTKTHSLEHGQDLNNNQNDTFQS